ncbi:hypothetical protein [Actinomadura sp. CNU-125]|nr:hypothetical protein [Actinomadura sp. CNU-125]
MRRFAIGRVRRAGAALGGAAVLLAGAAACGVAPPRRSRSPPWRSWSSA